VNGKNCNELAGMLLLMLWLVFPIFKLVAWFHNFVSAKADVDGFLVGGASLKPEFGEIIAAASAAPSKI
jgi:hypothetical protein